LILFAPPYSACWKPLKTAATRGAEPALIASLSKVCRITPLNGSEVAEDDAERARSLLQDAIVEAFAVTFPGAPTTGVASAGNHVSYRTQAAI
jgi:hypothetical protein